MRFENRVLRLPEGNFSTDVQIFEPKDRQTLAEIYRSWRSLCNRLSAIRSRSINLPEGLSEGAFCLEMPNVVRIPNPIPGATASFDCFDFSDHSRIQIKACSVLPDLTSFGPGSVWDKIYFCDFYREGNWDGTFDIYRVANELIYNHNVNRSQTFRDQQQQRRRPRFSIFGDIISQIGLHPLKTGRLF